MMINILYLLFGVYFGIVIFKTEVISWFRIQEMFRFDGFHMYGVLGMAVATGIIAVMILKKLHLKSADGSPMDFSGKPFTKGNIFGGIIFGLGWAMTGACPGPLYALIGGGYWIIIPVLVSAIFGAFVYGLVREKLPH